MVKTCPEGKLQLYAGKDGCGLACYICADDRCNGKCQNGAVCLDDGTCYCQNGWTGADCATCSGTISDGACCLIGQVWNVARNKCVTEGCPNNGIMTEDGTCDNNCPSGKYCKYNPTSNDAAALGFGSCVAVAKRSGSDGNWVMSAHKMDWWSSMNFCKAVGRRAVSRSEVCDGGLETIACREAPTQLKLREQFNASGYFNVWTRDTTGQRAYIVGLHNGEVGYNERHMNYNPTLQPFALCR